MNSQLFFCMFKEIPHLIRWMMGFFLINQQTHILMQVQGVELKWIYTKFY